MFYFTREALAHLISSERLRGLSKGVSLNIVKGSVALSISLTVYDLLRKRLNDYPHSESGSLIKFTEKHDKNHETDNEMHPYTRIYSLMYPNILNHRE